VEQLENPVEGESFEVSYGSFSDSDDGDLMKPSMKKLQRKPTINVVKKSPIKNSQMHEPSQLSVIADSSEVEILMIDKSSM